MTNRKYLDWPAAVSLGESGGNSVRNIFGYQESATTAFRALWGKASAYVFPSSAQQMQVKSSSGSDTMDLLILGLDSNYDEISETVTLTGTSVVTTTKSFLRLNDAIILSGNNVGTIDLGDDLAGSATFYKSIRAGDGRCQDSFYTVPRDHCFLLYRIDAFSSDGTSSKVAFFRNVVTNPSGRTLAVARTGFRDNMHIMRQMPFKYDEMTDIQLQGATDSGVHEISVFGEGVLADVTA